MPICRSWHPSCDIASGLPGFNGPFPSTSLDEISYVTLIQLLKSPMCKLYPINFVCVKSSFVLHKLAAL